MRKSIRLASFILEFIICLFLVVSCGTSKNIEVKNDKIKVTTTTTMLKDLIQTIGGDKVEVINLMGEGVDPHLYNASAGDIGKLSNSDIIVYGGLHLEGKMGDILGKLESTGKETLNVGDSLPKDLIILQEESTPDPHVWFDTNLWALEAEIVADKLSKMDEKNRDYYMSNLEKYKKELKELTIYVEQRINEIPESSRVLVTAHDAFGYFGRQFNLEVKSIQGVSTDSEAGTRDISELADFIVKRDIKAVFVESSVPKRTIESLQEAVRERGKELKIGGELYSDSLGDEKNNTETYIKTVKRNVDIIVDALK
ncbi:MAG: zinc ABC transporter substrate-binding protein [Sebaldella sp.]|nr:zinc ABC transporter substrate-binding protein [Sebaldella sp.]